MKLLRLAINTQRWDLAAHTIVLATATVLKNGGRPNAHTKKKEGSPTTQPKR